LTLTNPILF